MVVCTLYLLNKATCNIFGFDVSDPISLWIEYLNEVPKQTLTVGGASGTYQVGEKVTGTTSGAIGYVDTWTSGTGVLVVRGITNKANGFVASENNITPVDAIIF